MPLLNCIVLPASYFVGMNPRAAGPTVRASAVCAGQPAEQNANASGRADAHEIDHVHRSLACDESRKPSLMLAQSSESSWIRDGNGVPIRGCPRALVTQLTVRKAHGPVRWLTRNDPVALDS